MAFPIMISPSAGHTMLHPEGEPATYKGATAASNTPYIVSNVSSFPFTEIAPASTGPLWFQLYPKQDLDANRELIDKVQAAGARAIVVTIDQMAPEYERAGHYRNLIQNDRSSSAARAAVERRPTILIGSAIRGCGTPGNFSTTSGPW